MFHVSIAKAVSLAIISTSRSAESSVAWSAESVVVNELEAMVVCGEHVGTHGACDLAVLALEESGVLLDLVGLGVELVALGGLGRRESGHAARVPGGRRLGQQHDVPAGAERLLGGRGRAGCRLGRAGRRSGGGGRSAGGESADGEYSKGAPSRTAPINGGQGVSWCEGRDVPLCRLGDAHVIQATEVLTQTTSRSTRRQGHDAANLSLVPSLGRKTLR